MSKNPYTIPPALLTMLNEHTAGYLLYCIDNQGNICHIQQCDNAATAMGLNTYALKNLAAQDEAHDVQIHRNMFGDDEDDD